MEAGTGSNSVQVRVRTVQLIKNYHSVSRLALNDKGLIFKMIEHQSIIGLKQADHVGKPPMWLNQTRWGPNSKDFC